MKRLATSPWADAALGLGAFVVSLVDLLASHQLGAAHWSELTGVIVCCGVVPLRRRQPVATALITAVAAAMPGLLTSANVAYDLPSPAFITSFLIAYSLGTNVGLGIGLGTIAVLVIGEQVGIRIFNPVIEMLTIGPWVAGRVMSSRRELASRLEARNRELEAEKEAFAREAVRFERARIARELHDIVAHSLSMMVVQAGAGQRLVDLDPEVAAQTLEVIADVARSTRAEIDGLVHLLGQEPSHPEPALIEELIRRAASAGLDVTCRIEGDCSRLTDDSWQAAYRVVQEGLTNALKHAAGTPVEVTIREAGPNMELLVQNGRPVRTGTSSLSSSGGGHGLGGMRARIAACSGELTAGPTSEGGWLVTAKLPTAPAPV